MEKELHKLAVIFPGIGYTADKPLLYFGRRIAVEYGYEVRIMDYKGFPPKVKGDRNRMEESFFIALRQAAARFSTRRWKILSDFRSEKRLLLPAMTIRGSAKKTAGFPRSAKSGAFHAAWSLTRTTRWRARMFSRI